MLVEEFLHTNIYTNYPWRELSIPLLLLAVPISKHIFPLLFGLTDNPFDFVDDTVPYNFTLNFLVEPFRSDNIDLLVIVNSLVSDHETREKIRSSWAKSEFFNRNSTKIIFLLGNKYHNQDYETLAMEAEKHQDILVVDMVENYYTLSSKTYAMLYYKMTRFPQSNCLIKADSDNVLNIRNFENLCRDRGMLTPTIYGKCDVKRRVKRNDAKWAVPMSVYPMNFYPVYCSTGVFVFIGQHITSKLVTAAKKSKFAISENFRKLPEDVLFTGILPERAGIKRQHIEGLSFIDAPQYQCRNNIKYTYSIHMNRRKDPIYYFKKLLSMDGFPC